MNPNKALWEKGDFTRIAESMREARRQRPWRSPPAALRLRPLLVFANCWSRRNCVRNEGTGHAT